MGEQVFAHRLNWICVSQPSVRGLRDGNGADRNGEVEKDRRIIKGAGVCATEDRIPCEFESWTRARVQEAQILERFALVSRKPDAVAADSARTKKDALGEASGIVEPNGYIAAAPGRRGLALSEPSLNGE